MNWKILILLLSLILTSCVKTSVTKPKFSGHFTTEEIRTLWQMCSNGSLMKNIPAMIFIPTCDCYIDKMRGSYDNASVLQNMSQKDGEQLTVVLTLACNEYTIGSEANENASR